MKRLATVCLLIAPFLLAGCLHRQTGPRLVYVPSPPAVTAPAPAQEAGTIVIEEPAPPEPKSPPAETRQGEPTAQSSTAQRPRRSKPPVADTPAIPDEPPTAAEVPPLEPLERSDQGAQRGYIENSQKEVHQRIDKLNRARLSDPEHKTLEDAQNFLSQSEAALKESDLQRSEILVHKASLLIAALEHNH